MKTDSFQDLADRPISPFRNLVTASGLRQIETQIAELRTAYVKAAAALERLTTASTSIWPLHRHGILLRTASISIPHTGLCREVLEFVRFPHPFLEVGWGRFFGGNIWPDVRVFRIQRKPFLKPRFG